MDFIAKFTSFSEETPITPLGKLWQVYVDGLSCRAGRSVGVHIVTEQEEELNYAAKPTLRATDNEAEYKVLLARVTVARLLGAEEVEVRTPKWSLARCWGSLP